MDRMLQKVASDYINEVCGESGDIGEEMVANWVAKLP
jgi:hypothetical protein